MRKLPGKIAAINDLSGYGRCSLSVMLPVIAVCGYQCCPVPTAVLSTSNDYAHPFLRELTDDMPAYIAHWEQLGLEFDGIYTGYFSSAAQIDSALRFLRSFRKPGTVLLVDPVLGDHGKMSPRCQDPAFMQKYRPLIRQADLITPNLTEAFYLTGIPYEDDPAEETIDRAAQALLAAGTKNVLITGIGRGEQCCTYIYSGSEKHIAAAPYCPQERTGAGDLFASILLSKYLDGTPLAQAARQAAQFVAQVLQYSYVQNVPQQQGICFEPFLGQLSPYSTTKSVKE